MSICITQKAETFKYLMKQARKYGYGDHGFGFIRIISLLVYFVWTSTYLETLYGLETVCF